jgi:solute carrier family 31 (copper transporter), member 1
MLPHYIHLLLAFLLSAAVEWLTHCSRLHTSWSNHAADSLKLTTIHATRVTLAYFLMLAVMSFNLHVLVAVVLGHALGFFLFVRPAIQQAARVGDVAKVDLSSSMPC